MKNTKNPSNCVVKACALMDAYMNKPMTCKQYNKMLRSVYCSPVWFEEFRKVKYGHFKNGTPGVVIIGIETERKW